jgi:Ca-activated chloride channel family protein
MPMVRSWVIAGAMVAASAALFAAPSTQQTTPPPKTTPPPQTTPAQTPQVFRGGVRTVPVYATVNDGAGGFVLDLKKTDFEVYDNGKLQDVTTFTTDVQPLTTIVLLDGSGSMLQNFDAVIEGANNFVLRMMPDDKTRLGSFADIVKFGPDFTNNRDRLLAYLRDEFNIRMANETRLWDAMHEGIQLLGVHEGRRVELVFSDGYDTTSVVNSGSVEGEASGKDVTVYAIAMWTGRGTQQTRPNRYLEEVATSTGGGYYELSEQDDLNKAFTRIALELHQQYLLGFTPEKLDDKVHKLDVKVKRPNMKVRARKSYVASVNTDIK